jgi:hypothetical protein
LAGGQDENRDKKNEKEQEREIQNKLLISRFGEFRKKDVNLSFYRVIVSKINGYQYE